MNVIDSSAWLEYFADGPNASLFAPAIEDVALLVVPSITIYEVYRRIASQRGETDALTAVTAMHQGRIVELTAELSLSAARLGLAHRLPLADSIVLATARAHDAELWTQDADFDGLPGVQFRSKARPAH